MTEAIAEQRTKLERILKASRVRPIHIKAWCREPTGQSPWCSEIRKIHGDILHVKYLKYLEWSSRPSLPESYRNWVTKYVEIPPINRLIDEIKRSRNIMELEDNWDDEGSPGYTRLTWDRAVKFLLANALNLWRRHKMCFEAPRILPGPDGSIDLHWRTNKRELLINVPRNAEEPASYYGDDREEGTDNAIRGKKIDISANNEWIFLWLMK